MPLFVNVIEAAVREGRTVTHNPDGSIVISAPTNVNPFANLPEYDPVTGQGCDWRTGMDGKPVDANRNPDYHGWRGK